jgi:hypothetical protein
MSRICSEWIMNRHWHYTYMDNIGTKRNHEWENQLWVDVDTISTKKSFLFNRSRSCNGTRSWIDIDTILYISKISTQKEITIEGSCHESIRYIVSYVDIVNILSKSCLGNNSFCVVKDDRIGQSFVWDRVNWGPVSL